MIKQLSFFKITPKERFNVYSHAITTALYFIISFFILKQSYRYNLFYFIPSFIYCAGLIGCYLSSMLYHWADQIELKNKLRVIDHCFIFISSPTTYAPMLLIAFNNSTWPILFWIYLSFMAALGCYYELHLGKNSYQQKRGKPFMIAKILSGSLIILLPKFLATFPWYSILFNFASLATTSIGIWCYAKSKKDQVHEVYYHGLWHILAAIGSFLFLCGYFPTVYSFD